MRELLKRVEFGNYVLELVDYGRVIQIDFYANTSDSAYILESLKGISKKQAVDLFNQYSVSFKKVIYLVETLDKEKDFEEGIFLSNWPEKEISSGFSKRASSKFIEEFAEYL